MNKKTTGIVAYFTLIGFVIAYITGEKEEAKFHLNQALVIELFSLLSMLPIPVVRTIWSIIMLVFWVMGLVYAINEQEKEVLLIGKIKLLNGKSGKSGDEEKPEE